MLIKNKQTNTRLHYLWKNSAQAHQKASGRTDHMCRDYNLDIEKKLQNMHYAN